MHKRPSDQLREALQDHLQREGIGLQAFEDKHNFKRRSFGGFADPSRQQSPSVDKAAELCEALGLELFIGRPQDINPPSDDLLAEFALIERIDIELAAGSGRDTSDPQMLPPITFRRSWLAQNSLKPNQCVVLGVKGESMHPTLHDGDIVLIDKSAAEREIKTGDIYAFNGEDGLTRVKRIEKLSQHLVLKSDNPLHETEIIHDLEANRIQIIGKVVWSGHTWDV